MDFGFDRPKNTGFYPLRQTRTRNPSLWPSIFHIMTRPFCWVSGSPRNEHYVRRKINSENYVCRKINSENYVCRNINSTKWISCTGKNLIFTGVHEPPIKMDFGYGGNYVNTGFLSFPMIESQTNFAFGYCTQ